MLQLRFEVTHQHINRVDTEKPVSDSKYYLYAHFDFLTDDWEGKIVTAVFTKDEHSYHVLLDASYDCLVPWEVISAGDFYVSCFASDLITVSKARVYVAQSGYVENGENTEPPTPNIYDQLIEQFGELRAWTENAVKNIDGGNFTDWENEG